MPDREKVIKGLSICRHNSKCMECPYIYDGRAKESCCEDVLHMDALALLKEHEAVVKQWIKEIADNQLAHAPKDSHEFMSLDEHLENEYKRGIWDGLQIAWNIISEGR